MSNEARQIVQAGLERRKAAREAAAREAQLEQYEQDQIRCCNEHFASAKVLRLMNETDRMQQEQVKARQAAKAEALAKELKLEQAAAGAVKTYGVFCLAILCLTIFTHLPVWAAITTVAGMGVFPAAYIFRLYYPLDKQE